MSTRFLVFRHGETNWNREERFQGQLDIPLNEHGVAQARRLIEPLKRQRIQAILSSDLSRALATAETIADPLGIRIFSDARLREAHLGIAQGLTRAEIEAKLGVQWVDRWRSVQLTDADLSYPGGESGRAIMERTFACLEAFALQNPEIETLGVATHGGVIRRLMQRLLPERTESVPIPNGILYSVRFDPKQAMERRWSVSPFIPL